MYEGDWPLVVSSSFLLFCFLFYFNFYYCYFALVIVISIAAQVFGGGPIRVFLQLALSDVSSFSAVYSPHIPVDKEFSTLDRYSD
jgi:hypothetical protein